MADAHHRDKPQDRDDRHFAGGPLRAAGSRGTAGFSITEVLVSVMIVSIGVIAFATTVGLAARDIRLGQRHTDIAMLVSDQLEQLKSLPIDLVQNGQRNQGDYHLAWTVVDGDPKKVVLVVDYPGLKNTSRSDTIVALLPR